MKKDRRKLRRHGYMVNIIALALNTKEVCGQLRNWKKIVLEPRKFYKPGVQISR